MSDKSCEKSISDITYNSITGEIVVDNVNADHFYVISIKNAISKERKFTPSSWKRLSFVKSLLERYGKDAIRSCEGKGSKTSMKRDVMLSYLEWVSIGVSDSTILNMVYKKLGIDKKIRVKNIRREFSFGEDIVYNLFSDYDIIPQYPVLDGKYFIDWYVPALNIAIEFDESHHRLCEELDNFRQKEIEKELGCKFLRYKDR